MTSATGLVLTEPRSFEQRSFELPDVGADLAVADKVLGRVSRSGIDGYLGIEATEFKINLLAPVTGGTCVAAAEIISMSKRLAVVRVEIANGDRMVAVAQGTTTIVAPKNAS